MHLCYPRSSPTWGQISSCPDHPNSRWPQFWENQIHTFPKEEPHPLTRRTLLIGGAAVAVGGLLDGCGGGGAAPPTGGNGQVSGVVNLVEIGGAGLHIDSSTQRGVVMSVNGGFSTPIEGSAPQLLFVRDGTGQTRALAIAVPGASGQMAIDASSTLLALLFVSPGIATPSTTDALAHLSSLKTLPAFETALSDLRVLSTRMSLSQAILDSALSAALELCAQEWSQISRAKGRGITVGMAQSGVTAAVANQANLSAVAMSLSNSGWRYVRIQRRELASDGSELAVRSVITALNGATPATLGAIFGGTAFNPTVEPDPAHVNFTQDAHVEYWIEGPGWQAGQSLPPTVPSDDIKAWVESILFYLVLPFIQVVGGFAFDVPAVVNLLIAITETIANDAALAADVQTIINAKSDGERVTAILDFVVALLEDGVLAAGGLLTKNQSDFLLSALADLDLFFALWNLATALVTWVGYDRVAKIDVYATGSGTINVG